MGKVFCQTMLLGGALVAYSSAHAFEASHTSSAHSSSLGWKAYQASLDKFSCQIAIKKNVDKFPIYFCIGNQPSPDSPSSCTLTQIDLREGIQPLLGLSRQGSKTLPPENVHVTRSCQAGGVEKLLALPISATQNLLMWLVDSPLLGPNVQVYSISKEVEPVSLMELFREVGEELKQRPSEIPVPPAENRDTLGVPKTVTVPIFFASDRKYYAQKSPVETFSNERSEDGSLSLGLVNVTIPAAHIKGQLETASVFKLEFSPNSNSHIVLKSVEKLPFEDYYSRLKSKVGACRDQSLLLFVHGYNNTFEDAARRMAQITYDLRFSGAPVLYSWPSGKSLGDYTSAEANSDWSYRHLVWFLADLVSKTGAKNIYLIAHSMGNRVLTQALSTLVDKNLLRSQKTFRQVVLAAPDVDTQEFREIKSQIESVAQGITLYASSGDLPVATSAQIHAHPRLGDSKGSIAIFPGMDSIDASNVDHTLLGHSYIGDSTRVLQDLKLLLSGIDAQNRPNLEKERTSQGSYWKFLP